MPEDLPSWTRRIAGATGPKYGRIARAIAAAIEEGDLAAGDRLPPQRDLAEALDVTVGTVARGYREATERGLVGGHVGRGTFVLGPRPTGDREEPIDLTVNQPIDDGPRRASLEHARGLAGDRDLERLLRYGPDAEPHRAALAGWLARSGTDVAAGDVVLTAGAQHGLFVALSALVRPGDVVLTERWTYYGLKPIASMLGVTLAGVDLDEEGLRPDELERRARETGARVACLTPVLQNPTAVTWSEARFEAVANAVRALGLRVVEDDVYRCLLRDAPPALFARETGAVLVSSVSKALTAGLRVGAVAAGEDLLDAIAAAVSGTVAMLSPLTAEIATRLLRDVRVEEWLEAQRVALAARHAVVDSVLGSVLGPTRGEGLHAWLGTPAEMGASALRAAAARAGVLVSGGDVFAVDEDDAEAGIRISLGGRTTPERFAEALGRLRSVVGGGAPLPRAAGPLV